MRSRSSIAKPRLSHQLDSMAGLQERGPGNLAAGGKKCPARGPQRNLWSQRKIARRPQVSPFGAIYSRDHMQEQTTLESLLGNQRCVG